MVFEKKHSQSKIICLRKILDFFADSHEKQVRKINNKNIFCKLCLQKIPEALGNFKSVEMKALVAGIASNETIVSEAERKQQMFTFV
jgi:hypothetical protein